MIRLAIKLFRVFTASFRLIDQFKQCFSDIDQVDAHWVKLERTFSSGVVIHRSELLNL